MTSLTEMQLDWTAQDWLNTAAVYGSECAFLVRLVKTSADHNPTALAGGLDARYYAGCQDEASRMAHDFARRAAHAANMAELEAEKLAQFLNPEVAAVYEHLGKCDPRD